MFSRHVTKDISAYCHGELSSEASKQFAEHIISCVQCRIKFEDVKLGLKFAEQLPQLSAPDRLWQELEPLLDRQTDTPRNAAFRSWPIKVAAAAVFLLISSFGFWWLVTQRPFTSTKRTWQVQRLGGTPRIGAEAISGNGELAIGEWLETDESSRARIAVGSIGNVDVDENTRVRLLATQPNEHRLELARGKMSARIWAPPRLFFVDTPSAVAADLGCAYTLEVDDHGGSLLRVTSGWVALQLKDRESMVPQGAACETRPGIGPGTPYFEDAPAVFRDALREVDFNADAAARSTALSSMLDQARPRDTLTLWHLLSRVDGEDRARVYDKMVAVSPLPAGITREGVLQLDQTMLQAWRHTLESSWIGNGKVGPKKLAKGYWKVNGPSQRLKDMSPK
jgi:FecR protein